MRGSCFCADEGEIATECAREVESAVVRLRRHFRRPAAAEHAADYLRGLLAEVERKNGWQLAERAGYAHPRGIQQVLDRYAWDADAVRDDLRAYVLPALADPLGVLVVDETGFPKQGTRSAGVARQYCGTLGKRANCQVGVFLGYASPAGHVGLDRALYLPQEWTNDRARCRAAGIPDEVSFQTKPQLALALVERALDAGVPAAWVVADEVYGSDSKFREPLEAGDRPMCWPSGAISPFSPSRPGPPTGRRTSARSPTSSRPSRRPAGAGGAAGRGLRGPDATTGPTSPCARRYATAGSTPCWLAGTLNRPTSSPTT